MKDAYAKQMGKLSSAARAAGIKKLKAGKKLKVSKYSNSLSKSIGGSY